MRHKFKRQRRGATLVEMVVAIGLLAMIVAITISLLSISTSNVRKQEDAVEYQKGVDDFVYHLLLEMKSAESLIVSGDNEFPVLQIIGYDSSVVVYEVNNLRGTIYRNKSIDNFPVVEGINKCFFHEEDETSVTITIYMTEEESIEYTMRCGV